MDEEARRILPRTGYPRRRAVAACLVCRERKRKCDNSRPSCTSCLQIGATCQYARQDDSALDTGSLRILDQLSTIEALVRNIQPPMHIAPGHPDIPTEAGHLSGLSNTSVLPPRDEGDYLERFHTDNDAEGTPHALTDSILQWPIFRLLLAPLELLRYVDVKGVTVETYLDDIFHLSDVSPSARLFESQDGTHSLFNISNERQDIERPIDQFCDRVNIKNPIVSRQHVADCCRRYYENGPLFDLETCLVLLTCALGAVSMDFVPHDNLEDPQSPSQPTARISSLRLGRAYFTAAEKRIGPAMTSSSTVGIQCLCLAGIYHMYTIDPISALRMFRAAASPLQILTSTNSIGIKGLSQIDSSLFWMCYKSEREILAEIPISALTLKLPDNISSYPPPPVHVAGLDTQESWAASEKDSWYFFLSEIALRRITDSVSEIVSKYIDDSLRHESSSTTTIEDLIPIVAEFEHQAELFRKQLPEAISFPDVPQKCDTEWKQYSRGRYYRLLELMHRPFLFAVLHAQRVVNDSVICDLAEKSLVNALRYLEHSHRSHRHHGLWLQLRNELKEASLLLAASKCGAATSGMLSLPAEWEASIAKTLETFDYWSWEFPSCKTYANILLTMANAPALEGSVP